MSVICADKTRNWTGETASPGNSHLGCSLRSHPGAPCCPGHAPVARVVRDAGVVAGKTALKNTFCWLLCRRKNDVGSKCWQRLAVPKPSQTTKTMCRLALSHRPNVISPHSGLNRSRVLTSYLEFQHVDKMTNL